MTEQHLQTCSPTPTAAVLDAHALEALRRLDPGGAARLLPRLLHTYDQSLAKLLAQLDAAAARVDGVAMRFAVHTLKSSSASIGALELSRCCAAVEQALREDRLADAMTQLGGLRAAAARVASAVRQLLEAGASS